MTPLEIVARQVAEAGWELRKAVPRGPDRLLLELSAPDGRLAAGQWRQAHGQATDIAQQLVRTHGPGSAELLGEGVVVTPGGCDRRLRGLRDAVRSPGARLVAHRSERRAVVRCGDGSYAKYVRPNRLPALVAGLRPLDAPGLATPRIIAVSERAGGVRTAALPGRTLHEVLLDASTPDEAVAAELRRVGAAIATLHHAPSPADLSRHEPSDELDVARRWLRLATDAGLLRQQDWHTPMGRAEEALLGATSPPVRLHRDLHDKQLLLATGRPVGLLDLDQSAAGEAALDLANLLTHLSLRRWQGLLSHRRWSSAWTALLDGYDPRPATAARLPGYLLVSRLRLAAVYAFRAARPALVRQLLDPTTLQPTPDPVFTPTLDKEPAS